MPIDAALLLAILRLGHDLTARGAGLSFREAFERTGYATIRNEVRAADLVTLIRRDPTLVEQWLAYSQDKRTSGGWYLARGGWIGVVSEANSRRRFPSMEEAVAEYVLRELDFWAGVARAKA